MATHSSTLAWKIPWMGEPGRPWGPRVYGVAKSPKVQRDFTFTLELVFDSVSFHDIQLYFSTVQSVTQSCLTLCHPMNHSMPGLPVYQKLPEFTQTHVHRVGDAIEPSHPLLSPSSPAPNPSLHQGLFQRVSSSHGCVS